MAQHLGWRSFWWLNTALLGFVAVCCICFFPETRYNRNFTSGNSLVSVLPPLKASSAEKIEICPDNETLVQDHADPEKAVQMQSQNNGNLTHTHTHQDPWLGRGKPSKAQWRLYQPYSGSLFMEFLLPWKLFLFPIVQFSSFVVSWSASSFLTLNLTQSQAFAAPPYNFTSSKIGFFNFAILIGAVIGLLTAGPLSDAIAAWLTRRNRGIREPEMRCK